MMKRSFPVLGFAAALLAACAALRAHPRDATEPARVVLARALAAMGGEAHLRAVARVQVTGIGHLFLVEQSERPEGPYGVNYEQFEELRDFAGHRLRRRSRWLGAQYPEWTELEQRMAEDGGEFVVGGRSLPARSGMIARSRSPAAS